MDEQQRIYGLAKLILRQKEDKAGNIPQDFYFRDAAYQVASAFVNLVDDIDLYHENGKMELLIEAHARFCNYEMDVDDHPPLDHRVFMEKLASFILVTNNE